jgi:anti-anti-sigma factor
LTVEQISPHSGYFATGKVAQMADGEFGSLQTERLGESLWLLNLVGDHDLATEGRVGDAFARIEATGTTIVVDLSQATFIDSTVIGQIVASRERGETLLLVVPKHGMVHRILDLVGLRIPMFETREEAFQAVPGEDDPDA